MLLGQGRDVGADAVAAAEDDEHLAVERRAQAVLGLGRRHRVGGELEELVGDEHVDRVGDLHVALLAGHDPDRDVGEVAEHDTAVVGSPEVGISSGDVVRLAQHGGTERLRGLATTEVVAHRDLPDGVLRRDLDDRVGRRDGDVDGVVGVEGVEAVADDPGADHGAYGVVEEQLAVAVADRVEGAQRRAVAGVGALEDRGDLVVLAAAQDRVHRIEVPGRHHHDDLVDHRVLLHGDEGVLEDRLAGDLDELLGDVQADARADAPGEQDRDVGALRRLGAGHESRSRRTSAPIRPRRPVSGRSASRAASSAAWAAVSSWRTLRAPLRRSRRSPARVRFRLTS